MTYYANESNIFRAIHSYTMSCWIVPRATTNKKLRETVSLELSFVNSNLQLLKEQLAELNSSVEVYQAPDVSDAHIPMIPLGLKETKDVPFQDCIQVLTYNQINNH